MVVEPGGQLGEAVLDDAPRALAVQVRAADRADLVLVVAQPGAHFIVLALQLRRRAAAAVAVGAQRRDAGPAARLELLALRLALLEVRRQLQQLRVARAHALVVLPQAVVRVLDLGLLVAQADVHLREGLGVLRGRRHQVRHVALERVELVLRRTQHGGVVAQPRLELRGRVGRQRRGRGRRERRLRLQRRVELERRLQHVDALLHRVELLREVRREALAGVREIRGRARRAGLGRALAEVIKVCFIVLRSVLF